MDPVRHRAVPGKPTALLTILLCLAVPGLACLLYASPCHGFSLAEARGVGARAIGMGGAFTGVADDPSANYYNPAGLIQMNDHHSQVEYLMVFPRVYVGRGDGPAEIYLDKEIKAPMLSLVLDISRHWSLPRKVRVGFAGYFPHNFKSAGQIRYGTFYDPYYPLYGDSSVNQVLAAWINTAVEITPWLYLGVGFLFGSDANNIDLRMSMDTGNMELVMTRSTVKWNMTTEMRPMFGVMLKPLPDLRLGFTFRKGIKLLFDGGIRVNADLYTQGENGESIVPAPIPGFPIEVPINSHWRPLQYAAGASYKLFPRLLLAFDLTYYDWRAYRDEAGEAPNPSLKGVLTPRFGVEVFPWEALALRAGYGYMPSPLDQQVRTWVNYLDNDVHVFSVGAGYKWDLFGQLPHPMGFSFAYQVSYLVPRTFLNVIPGEPPLRSTGYIQTLAFGLELVF